jgi:hypothetical protein
VVVEAAPGVDHVGGDDVRRSRVILKGLEEQRHQQQAASRAVVICFGHEPLGPREPAVRLRRPAA